MKLAYNGPPDGVTIGGKKIEPPVKKPRKCANCYWWSQKILWVVGIGPMKAMCLNKDSDNHQRMTSIRETCDAWETDKDGNADG